jgi:hypothetical protein
VRVGCGKGVAFRLLFGGTELKKKGMINIYGNAQPISNSGYEVGK